MPLGTVFWIIMLLAFIFYWWGYWGGKPPYWPMGTGLFVFVLLFLLGWKVFGFMIRG